MAIGQRSFTAIFKSRRARLKARKRTIPAIMASSCIPKSFGE